MGKTDLWWEASVWGDRELRSVLRDNLEGRIGRGKDMYLWLITSMYSRNYHNIVKQLYLNLKNLIMQSRV